MHSQNLYLPDANFYLSRAIGQLLFEPWESIVKRLKVWKKSGDKGWSEPIFSTIFQVSTISIWKHLPEYQVRQVHNGLCRENLWTLTGTCRNRDFTCPRQWVNRIVEPGLYSVGIIYSGYSLIRTYVCSCDSFLVREFPYERIDEKRKLILFAVLTSSL